jgi:DNA-binding response OmpR family regulator
LREVFNGVKTMAGEKILVVDDEKEIADLIRLYLIGEGYEVLLANTGNQAMELFHVHKPDLIILDVLLPDLDGFEICRQVKAQAITPIIFLSSKDKNLDKIVGLEIGGDDYMIKPFDPAELMARVKAHLRRARLGGLTPNQVLKFVDLEINLDHFTVKNRGGSVVLSAREFQILALLAQNPGRIFNAEQIYRLVWNDNNPVDWRTIPVHISNLRKKIEKDPSHPQYILTVKGLGYKFNGLSEQLADTSFSAE